MNINHSYTNQWTVLKEKLILTLLPMLGVSVVALQNLDTMHRTGTETPGVCPRKSVPGIGAACSASAVSERW